MYLASSIIGGVTENKDLGSEESLERKYTIVEYTKMSLEKKKTNPRWTEIPTRSN